MKNNLATFGVLILAFLCLGAATVGVFPWSVTNPTNGQVLTYVSADGQWENGSGGSSGVSSVGLALPSFITVTNSPVTSSGTLTGTLATQVANTIFAGPTTGSPAAPTYRAVVAADIPQSVAISSSIKKVTFTFNGAGGVVATGVKYATAIKIPYGGSVIGYTLVCYPAASGVNNFDLLRSANAAGVASATSIIGAGTKPFINTSTSTSTTENSGAPSSWTSTTLNNNDNLIGQVTAADGTIQSATLVVYYQ